MSEANQQFDSHADWVANASRWLTKYGEFVHAVCIDAKGRWCHNGGDFRRAKDQDAFPVRWIWPEQVADMVTEVEWNTGKVATHSVTSTQAIRAFEAERHRQIVDLGFTPEIDDEYVDGELSLAAACYASVGHLDRPQLYERPPPGWPWPAQAWKPGTTLRNLEKAGALLVAEYDRILRAVAKNRKD